MKQILYGGVSHVDMEVEEYDLGSGVMLRRTYAHIMAPHLMAFKRPLAGEHHPPPWKSAKGGFAYDIELELAVPNESEPNEENSAREAIWWIAALLRMAYVPYLVVPVLSDMSFASVVNSELEPTFEPFEIDGRYFSAPQDARPLTAEMLGWVRDNWQLAGEHLRKNKNFYAAARAFDAATVKGRLSSSVLMLWGALEQLFSPSPGELRFRVASLISAYLEDPGTERLRLYKKILKLYDDRSAAAHRASEPAKETLVETYVIARNALIKMIGEHNVPTLTDLEDRLFNCSSKT